MHRHHLQKLTVLAALLWMLSACLSGCQADPCRSVSCNNGVCHEGECDCLQGWAGARCDSLLRDRLIGDLWQNSLHCQSGSNLFAASITAVTGATDEIDIHNLYSTGDIVRAHLRADTLWIDKQPYALDYIEGWGLYEQRHFTVDFHVQTTTGDETNCLAVFGR